MFKSGNFSSHSILRYKSGPHTASLSMITAPHSEKHKNNITTISRLSGWINLHRKKVGLFSLAASISAIAIGISHYSTITTARPLLSSIYTSPYTSLCVIQRTCSFHPLLANPAQSIKYRMSSKANDQSSGKNAPGWDLIANPYPPARRSDDVHIYKSAKHGEVKVQDPYFWLEIPPSESKETKEWTTAQAAFTDAYSKDCHDREEMKKRLEANMNYARYGSPSRKGSEPGQSGDYYYSYNSGLDPQATMYKASKDDLLEAEKNGYSFPPGQKWFDQNVSLLEALCKRRLLLILFSLP